MGKKKKENDIHIPKKSIKFDKIVNLVDEGKNAVEIMLIMNFKSCHTLVSALYGASCSIDRLLNVEINNKMLNYITNLRNRAKLVVGLEATQYEIDSAALEMISVK